MKTKILLSLAGAIVLMLSGCSTKEPTVLTQQQIKTEFTDAPKWVLNATEEQGISASGSALVGKAGMQFAITEAEANARVQMARQIEVKVSALLKTFTQQTGIKDGQTVDKVISDVSKQLTQQNVVGTKRKDMWISPSGELWVLMIATTETINEVKTTVASSFGSGNARYQQEQAAKAQVELNSELDKLIITQ
jgi:hypothetical protein